MSLQELVEKIKAANVSKDSLMVILDKETNNFQRVTMDALSFLNITGYYSYTYPNGDILSDKYSTHGDVVSFRTIHTGKIVSDETDKKNIWDVHGLMYNSNEREFGFVSDLLSFYDGVLNGRYGTSEDFSSNVGQIVVEWEQPTIISDVEIMTHKPTIEINDSYGHKKVGSYKFPIIAFIKGEKLNKEFYIRKVDEMK